MDLRLVAPLITDPSRRTWARPIEFVAHNPGDWFFHCHKPMHMEGGMIALSKSPGDGRASEERSNELRPRKDWHIVTPWLVP
jgi:hypothetical protein